MKPVKLTGIQYAALPHRLVGRQVEVLLVTSRRTRRWIIPKGWPMNGKTAPQAAALEAVEEAGVVGMIADRPIGSYRYLKRLKNSDETMAIQVIVFPFLVEASVEAFKEEGQRTARWFGYRQAAGLVAEPALRRLIREFGGARSAGFFSRTLRSYRAWRFGVPA
jgi:8-oxo-dGTP pyrophosphatase MutT (NUDIX family)